MLAIAFGIGPIGIFVNCDMTS